MSTQYEVRDLSVRYAGTRPGERSALGQVSFSVEAGQGLALLGASGSGKSTLLNVLASLTPVSSGIVAFGGQRLDAMGRAALVDYRANAIGLVFQHYCLLPHLSLLDNVLLPVQMEREGQQGWRERAAELLAEFGISELGGRRPHQVSGGQAQRCAIARSLIRRPRVILADEPTGNLDDDNAEHVLDILSGLSARGTTVICATHSERVARRLGRSLRLEHGSVAPE